MPLSITYFSHLRDYLEIIRRLGPQWGRRYLRELRRHRRLYELQPRRVRLLGREVAPVRIWTAHL